MIHSKDTLDVFTYCVRNKIVTTEEVAGVLSRSRFWAVGMLALLEESGLIQKTLRPGYDGDEGVFFEAFYADEVKALVKYTAVVSSKVEILPYEKDS